MELGLYNISFPRFLGSRNPNITSENSIWRKTKMAAKLVHGMYFSPRKYIHVQCTYSQCTFDCNRPMFIHVQSVSNWIFSTKLHQFWKVSCVPIRNFRRRPPKLRQNGFLSLEMPSLNGIWLHGVFFKA